MARVVEYLPLIFGSVLLVSALFLVLKRSLDTNVLPMLLIGAALIFIADKGILNLKFGATGVEFVRSDLNKAKEDYTATFAKLDGQLTEQKKLLDETRKALSDVLKSPAVGTPTVSVDTVNRLASPDARANADFVKNSPYSILVFYRTGQKAVADEITARLLAAGFQSAATLTDLQEVVPQLSAAREPGSIVVAAKKPNEDFVGRVRTIVQAVVQKFPKSTVRFDNDEWTFRRGDVQIYLF